MTRDLDSAVVYAVELLSHYGFELRGYTAQELVNQWLKNYPATWIRLAVIEALYQGRYKAISVEQILAVWSRRGQPIYRFNHDFERLICRKLPQSLTAPANRDSTDLNPESNLWPPTASSPDPPDESLIVIIQEEPVLTDHPDNSLPEPTIIEEVSEIPLPVDHPVPETETDHDASLSYGVDWSRREANKNPIHQFTPPSDDSDFYLKLKKVVAQQDVTPEGVGSGE